MGKNSLLQMFLFLNLFQIKVYLLSVCLQGHTPKLSVEIPVYYDSIIFLIESVLHTSFLAVLLNFDQYIYI